jgi:hypothetical protein
MALRPCETQLMEKIKSDPEPEPEAPRPLPSPPAGDSQKVAFSLGDSADADLDSNGIDTKSPDLSNGEMSAISVHTTVIDTLLVVDSPRLCIASSLTLPVLALNVCTYCMLYVLGLKNSTQHGVASYPGKLSCTQGMG